MTELSFVVLKRMKKELTGMINHVPELFNKIVQYAAKFQELISCVLSEHVPHYVDEFFLKVSVIMDILDTLECGRLRSEYLITIHHKYIFDGKLGSFTKPSQLEIGLKLTSCSVDGINYCLNKLPRQSNPDEEEQMNSFGATLLVLADICNTTRKKVADLAKDTLINSLASTNGKYSASATHFKAHFNNFYGFQFNYMRKPVIDRKKRTVSRDYRYLLFTKMLMAETSGRDLFGEFNGDDILSPDEYSHAEILQKLMQRIAEQAVTEKRELRHLLKAKAQRDLQAEQGRANSAAAELVLQEKYARMTDEEKEAFDSNINEGHRMAKSAFSTQAKTDSASESEDSLDEEDPSEDVSEKLSASARHHSSKLKKKSSSRRRLSTPVRGVDLDADSDLDSNSTPPAAASSSSSSVGLLTSPASVPSAEDVARKAASFNDMLSDGSHLEGSLLRNVGTDDDDDLQFTGDNYYDDEDEGSEVVGDEETFRQDQIEFNDPDSDCPFEEETEHDARNETAYEDCDEDGYLDDDVSDHDGVRLVDVELEDGMEDLQDQASAMTVSNQPTVTRRLAHGGVEDLLPKLVRSTKKRKRGVLQADDHVVLMERETALNERNIQKAQLREEKEKSRVEKAASDKAARDEKVKSIREKIALYQQAAAHRLDDNNGALGVEEKSRKSRVSVGLSQSQIVGYVADYSLNSLDREMVKGVCRDLFKLDEDGQSVKDIKRMEKKKIKSYREKLNISCDKAFQQSLIKTIHLDIFKEITIERLVTGYMVAKREAVGAKDGDIIDIDFFALLHEIKKTLNEKFSIDNDACMRKIDTLINNSNRMSNSDKAALKKQFRDSAISFRVSTLRKIQSVIAKTLARISSIWESLNFSVIGGNGGLPSAAVSRKKSRGALFAFVASTYGVFSEDNFDGLVDVVGVDDFARQVLLSSTNEDGSIDKLIEYQLIPKSQYYNIPKNNAALGVFLDRAAEAHERNVIATSAVLGGESVSLVPVINGSQLPSICAGGDTASGLLLLSPIARASGGSSFLQSDVETSFGTENAGEDAEMSFSDEDTTNHHLTTTSSSSSSVSDITSSQQRNNSCNGVVVREMRPVSVDFPFVERSRDSAAPNTALAYRNSVSISSVLKSFLKELLTDVSGVTDISVIRLNSTSNSRESGMTNFIQFLDFHRESSIDVLFDQFVESVFYRKLTCRWLTPFKKSDFNSIIPDGYCFYRALFQTVLRCDEHYIASQSVMQRQDRSLKINNGDGGGRDHFEVFFQRLEDLLPEMYGKSRVMNAHMTFFNLKCCLDEAFWGVVDAVAFLDFNCTAFVYCKDRFLDGYWAQYKCSSVFALESRDLVVEKMVGTAPTFAEIKQVVDEEPSYIILKNSHYFVTEHNSKLDTQAANVDCVKQILVHLQRKISIAAAALSTEEPSLTLSSICDRVSVRTSTEEDRKCLVRATEAISGNLHSEGDNIELEEMLLNELTESASVIQKQSEEAKEKKTQQKSVLAAACASSQAEFVGVIDNLFTAKEQLESALAELKALKRMILVSAVAKENNNTLVTFDDDSVNAPLI